ncbi:hypothetical protein GQR58_008886 [Nymphon striatum]|nr:hypothetical protein GQR58_008886 [Nymphon striatum]
MHTLMSFAGSVGALMANSGLENILQTAFGGVAKNGMVVWSSKMANPKLSTAPELKSLPSITDAFELHVYRTHYQAVIWRVSLKPNAHELDPVLYGWCINGYQYACTGKVTLRQTGILPKGERKNSQLLHAKKPDLSTNWFEPPQNSVREYKIEREREREKEKRNRKERKI